VSNTFVVLSRPQAHVLPSPARLPEDVTAGPFQAATATTRKPRPSPKPRRSTGQKLLVPPTTPIICHPRRSSRRNKQQGPFPACIIMVDGSAHQFTTPLMTKASSDYLDLQQPCDSGSGTSTVASNWEAVSAAQVLLVPLIRLPSLMPLLMSPSHCHA
jgi:hypothetical protein